MPELTDNDGTRAISEEEAEGFRKAGAAAHAQLFATLTWQPIAAFDSTAASPVFVRNGNDWQLAEWHDGRWQEVGGLFNGAALRFVPQQFATATDDVIAAYSED